MRADHRTELHRHQGVLSGDRPDDGEHVVDVVAGPVGDGQALQRRVPGHLGCQVAQGARAGALLGLLGHLAVFDHDDRLDREERAQEGLRAADAAAALEELEPAQHAEDADPARPVLRCGDQLVQARSGGGLLGGGDRP